MGAGPVLSSRPARRPRCPPWAEAGGQGAARGPDVCRAGAASPLAPLQAAPGPREPSRTGGRLLGQPWVSWAPTRAGHVDSGPPRSRQASPARPGAHRALPPPRVGAGAELSAGAQVSTRQGCSPAGSRRAAGAWTAGRVSSCRACGAALQAWRAPVESFCLGP